MSVDLSFDLYRLVYFLASAAVAIGAVDAAVTVAWRGAEYRLVVGGGTCSVGFDAQRGFQKLPQCIQSTYSYSVVPEGRA